MNIAPTLAKRLASLNISYDVIHHDYSVSNSKSARSAHIPTSKMVKPVIFEDFKGYVMALVPADQKVQVKQLNTITNRRMKLSSEAEIDKLFSDCELGAIPPVGDAYGITTIVDTQLSYCNNVYIESGTHTELLHLSGRSFKRLMAKAFHAPICPH